MNRASMQILMAELGPVLEPLEIISNEEDGEWKLVMDQNTTVFVDLDEERGKTTVSVEVARIGDDVRSKVYRDLLISSGRCQSNSGLRFGLDGLSGNVMAIVGFPVQPDAETLQATLSDFVARVSEWRDRLKEVGTDEPYGSGMTDPKDDAGFIRV